MNKRQIDILSASSKICDAVVESIKRRSKGELNCGSYCPGEDKLIVTLKQLAAEFKELEPECCGRLEVELNNLVQQDIQCVNPFSFGALVAIVGILRKKYIEVSNCSKKIFISHSSNDSVLVNAFIKDILKIGCGFKDSDIFCTLDSTAIKTGDDFREKIVDNMRNCDIILLFISQNYNASEVCKNELGAAWALKNKRVLPFVLPGTEFDQMGFLNVVKQGALVTDRRKLDEFYGDVCEYYSIATDWPSFNKAKEEFVGSFE